MIFYLNIWMDPSRCLIILYLSGLVCIYTYTHTHIICVWEKGTWCLGNWEREREVHRNAGDEGHRSARVFSISEHEGVLSNPTSAGKTLVNCVIIICQGNISTFGIQSHHMVWYYCISLNIQNLLTNSRSRWNYTIIIPVRNI